MNVERNSPEERLGALAMKAIDALAEYGEGAVMEDAFLVLDVSLPEDEDGETMTEYVIKCTTHRPTVALGLAARAVDLLNGDYTRIEEDE